MRFIIIMLVGLSACATPPRVLDYPALSLRIIKIDPRQAPCDKANWDCCIRFSEGAEPDLIFAGNSACLTHELRHLDRHLAGEKDDTHEGGWDWEQ